MRQNGQMWSVRIILVLVGVLIAVGIVAGYLYAAAQSGSREAMRLELFKGVLQLAGIVIIGGAVALLYKWVERSWDAAREQSELRRRYIDRLGDAYRAVREARRLLRACGIRGVTGPAEAELTPAQLRCYDEQMIRISREQLKLEALRIESQYFPPTVNGAELSTEIGAMERYLERLITEYERYRPEGTVRLRDLKRLREFTRGAGEDAGTVDPRAGTLQENFVKPHYRAIACISQ